MPAGVMNRRRGGVTWPSPTSLPYTKIHQKQGEVKAREWAGDGLIRSSGGRRMRLRAPSQHGLFRRRPAAAACFSRTSYPSPAPPAERRTSCCPGPPNELRRYGYARTEAIEAANEGMLTRRADTPAGRPARSWPFDGCSMYVAAMTAQDCCHVHLEFTDHV